MGAEKSGPCHKDAGVKQASGGVRRPVLMFSFAGSPHLTSRNPEKFVCSIGPHCPNKGQQLAASGTCGSPQAAAAPRGTPKPELPAAPEIWGHEQGERRSGGDRKVGLRGSTRGQLGAH